MSNIIEFPKNNNTKCDKVLRSRLGHFERVLIIGLDNDNTLHFSSSSSNTGDILHMMERAKFLLMVEENGIH